MRIRYSLRSILWLIAAVSVTLALYYYWVKGDSVYYRTESGFVCRIFTDTFFCDAAEGVYCDVRMGNRLVVSETWIDALSCSDSLSRDSYAVNELDGGQGICVISTDALMRKFKEDAVLLVFTKDDGLLHPNLRNLPSDMRRKLVEEFFPSDRRVR